MRVAEISDLILEQMRKTENNLDFENTIRQIEDLGYNIDNKAIRTFITNKQKSQ